MSKILPFVISPSAIDNLRFRFPSAVNPVESGGNSYTFREIELGTNYEFFCTMRWLAITEQYFELLYNFLNGTTKKDDCFAIEPAFLPLRFPPRTVRPNIPYRRGSDPFTIQDSYPASLSILSYIYTYHGPLFFSILSEIEITTLQRGLYNISVEVRHTPPYIIVDGSKFLMYSSYEASLVPQELGIAQSPPYALLFTPMMVSEYTFEAQSNLGNLVWSTVNPDLSISSTRRGELVTVTSLSGKPLAFQPSPDFRDTNILEVRPLEYPKMFLRVRLVNGSKESINAFLVDAAYVVAYYELPLEWDFTGTPLPLSSVPYSIGGSSVDYVLADESLNLVLNDLNEPILTIPATAISGDRIRFVFNYPRIRRGTPVRWTLYAHNPASDSWSVEETRLISPSSLTFNLYLRTRIWYYYEITVRMPLGSVETYKSKALYVDPSWIT